MALGKYYKPEEEQNLLEMFKQGFTKEEVAELLNRPVHGIEVKLRRMGYMLVDGKLVEIEQNSQAEAGMTPSEKTLNDFTVRQIIKNLYDRGCRLKIRNNKPVIVTECLINLADIINNG